MKTELEEAAWKYNPLNKLDGLFIRQAFIEGAKYQSERSYSEEEVGELVYAIIGQYANKVNIMINGSIIDGLFEQFKKKA
jgi:hypothetical protein